MDDKVTTVIIHCSDSSFGNAATIAKWHVMPPPLGRGWNAIGYHYVILNGWLSYSRHHHYFDGYIETGRPLDDDTDISSDEFGAHATGWNNAVGICLIGLSGTFTEKQLLMLRQLIRMIRTQFHKIDIKQHCDVDPVNRPKCAGLPAEFIKELNSMP
jgi:N-acetylmuramoyl-L-alanine amidase